MKALRISLNDKYIAESGKALMSGVQALVRLPMDQARIDRENGLNTGGFISGYRGSPLGGYDQQLMRAKKFLDPLNIRFQPGVNEDLAATAVWGSQQVNLHPGATVDGVFGIWYGKAPGVDRTGDVFRHANWTGTWKHGGVLAIAGDDPTAKSSTMPSQSEYAFHDWEMPVLAPSCVQEVLDLGLHGIAMSRYSGLWVGFIALADVMDGSATVDIDPARLGFAELPDMEHDRHVTLSRLTLQGREGAEERLRGSKLPAAKLYGRLNRLNQIVWDSSKPRLGLAVSGKNWMALREALRLLNISEADAERLGLRLMKISMPWPLDENDMAAFGRRLETVLVVESKRPLIETQLKETLYHIDADKRPAIAGKRDCTGAPLLQETSDLEAADIATALYKFLPEEARTDELTRKLETFEKRRNFARMIATPSPRTPYFCSGCPHNSSTVVPEGSRAMAGIGCHIMAQTMEGRAEDAFTQMGGEGVAWLGQSDFTNTQHIFVNLGDGTYHHSGILAIRAAISAKVNITYKILYNDAVAMTGGQSVDGPLSVADISRQVAAEGVERIVVLAENPQRHSPHSLGPGVTVHNRDDLDQVQRDLRNFEGVSVLIFDQTCAAEKRRRRKRGQFPTPKKRLFINERVCENCGDCSLKSNCISVEPVETDFGTKRRINQSACNMDFSCAKGFCPSFMEIEGGQLNTGNIALSILIDAARDLPMPSSSSDVRESKILLTGIGGTGVTTTSAILAMAAHMDGKQAATLDVTGLAQKGGAVLSYLSIAPKGAQAPFAKIAPGEADVILAGDMIVAAGDSCLTLCDPERTVAIADADIAPTAEFVMHGTQTYRTSRPQIRLRNSVRRLRSGNVSSMAETLVGDALFGNMMLMGLAWQDGCLPLSLQAIEQAIRLNGAAVDSNLSAFHAGRLLAAKPDALEPFLPMRKPVRSESLDQLIARLGRELTDYQDEAYARRFLRLVAKARTQEVHLRGNQGADNDLPFTEAVARGFFKLMAYKDEYEVARLYADPGFRKRLEETFRDKGRPSILLAPPLLSRIDTATGRPRKMRFGPWVFTAFRLLASLKGLRGGRFDLFGYTQERRMERQLIADYEQMIEQLLPHLANANLSKATEIAKLAEHIRGFGPVKLANIEKATAMKIKLLSEFARISTDKVETPDYELVAAE